MSTKLSLPTSRLSELLPPWNSALWPSANPSMTKLANLLIARNGPGWGEYTWLGSGGIHRHQQPEPCTAAETKSNSVLVPVYPLCVPEWKVLHIARQRNVCDLNQKMNMDSHKAEGMNPVSKSIAAFLKQEVETIPVFVIEKDILSGVSTQNHLIMRCSIFTGLTPYYSQFKTPLI